MNVRLVRFHYDFTMTGKVRDLFSIGCLSIGIQY